jgi:hypothetical protein
MAGSFGAASLILVVGLLWITQRPDDLRFIGPTATPTFDYTGWQSYRHPELGFKVKYPKSWHSQTMPNDLSRYVDRGVFISNVLHTFKHPVIPGGVTSAWDFTQLPSDAVVVEFHQTIPRLFFSQRQKRDEATTFPLAVSVVNSERTLRVDGILQRLQRSVVIPGDHNYDLRVYTGKAASTADERIAEQIVASIEFDWVVGPAGHCDETSPPVEVSIRAPLEGEHYGARVPLTIITSCVDATFRVSVDGVPYEIVPWSGDVLAARDLSKPAASDEDAEVTASDVYALIQLDPGVHSISVTQGSRGSGLPRIRETSVRFIVYDRTSPSPDR